MTVSLNSWRMRNKATSYFFCVFPFMGSLIFTPLVFSLFFSPYFIFSLLSIYLHFPLFLQISNIISVFLWLISLSYLLYLSICVSKHLLYLYFFLFFTLFFYSSPLLFQFLSLSYLFNLYFPIFLYPASSFHSLSLSLRSFLSAVPAFLLTPSPPSNPIALQHLMSLELCKNLAMK